MTSDATTVTASAASSDGDSDRWTELARVDDWVSLDAEFAQGARDTSRAAEKWYRDHGRALMSSWLYAPADLPQRISRLAVRVRLETSPKRLLRDLRREFRGATAATTTAAMTARGTDWVDRVVAAATSERADRRNDALPLIFYRLVSRAVTELGMRAPIRCDLYLEGWAREFGFSPWPPQLEEPALPPDQRMASVLDSTPDLVPTVLAALARPDGFRQVAIPERSGSLPIELARRLVDAGSRSAAIDACIESLARSDSPASQRNIARLLSALDPQPDDIAPRLPLVLGAATTCSDSTLAALLPVLLDSRLRADDLLDLGRTVLERAAKGPKATLVRWLARAIDVPVIADAARELLVFAAQAEDVSLATAASKALGAPAPAASESSFSRVEWGPVDPRVVYPAASRRAAIERSASGFALAAAAESEPGIRGSNSAWLEALRGWQLDDPATLRRALINLGEIKHWSASRALVLAAQWAQVGRLRISYRHEYIVQRHVEGRLVPVRHFVDHWPTPTSWFTDLLVAETLTRARDGTGLLSTTHADGSTLGVSELAARIRSWPRRSTWSPYDLQQALWRLRPSATDPELATLDGLRLRGPGLRSPDGVALIRRWMSGERFLVPGVKRAFARVDDSQYDPAHPIPFLREHGIHLFDPGAVGTHLDVRPFSADDIAARSRGGYVNLTSMLLSAPGPWASGLAGYLADLTVSEKSTDRSDTALALASLAARGQYNGDLYTREVMLAQRGGGFSLTRAADTWEQVILLGGFQDLWPTISCVVGEAASLPRIPAGLADVLRMLRRYAPALPAEETVPSALAALAARRGTSKTQNEARALIEARR